ncbi:MAG: hypothetical protein KAY32_15380 [Candidatus Eisenbacteria sp.]|nr:hypothetical protein [Candidatus Eisenbacteria bacterium]
MGNKTKLQMRADLAVDLKITIDTELSRPELDRCIDRAYSDLSRFLPDEKISEDSLQFAVADEEVTFPLDAVAGQVVATEALEGVVAGSLCTIDGQPDVPRPLRYLLSDANNSIQGMTVIVEGIDKDDQALQEVSCYTKGDDKLWMGKKYFKAVYSVEFDQITGNASPDQFEVGIGDYTDVWVYLANSPIKWQSDSGVGDDDVAIVRNTDYYIDYANGRVKAISGGLIAAGEVCEFTYTKSQIGIDLSDLPDLIRVQRVEYPIGQVPQVFVTGDAFGKYYVVTGAGESEEQQQMAEDEQYRIYYDAKHQVANLYSPGSEPSFLTDTVLLASGAYALYILALKQEHQAVTDLGLARTALGNATGTHSALGLALDDMELYLDNSGSPGAEDAIGRLAQITTDIAYLDNAIIAATEAMNAYLDAVGAASTGDIALSNAVKALYMTSPNYVNGGSEPDILTYLTTGDALLNTVPVGGEGQDVPRAYREYAQAVKDSLVAAFENDRAMYLQGATARTNAAMGYANEAAQRLSLLRAHIERGAAYIAVADTFGTEAGHILSQIMAYLQQASQCIGTASADMASADRFRDGANERRNEVYSIWRDRKQYIGDFTAGAMRQYP